MASYLTTHNLYVARVFYRIHLTVSPREISWPLPSTFYDWPIEELCVPLLLSLPPDSVYPNPQRITNKSCTELPLMQICYNYIIIIVLQETTTKVTLANYLSSRRFCPWPVSCSIELSKFMDCGLCKRSPRMAIKFVRSRDTIERWVQSRFIDHGQCLTIGKGGEGNFGLQFWKYIVDRNQRYHLEIPWSDCGFH